MQCTSFRNYTHPDHQRIKTGMNKPKKKRQKYSEILPTNEKIIETGHIHWIIFSVPVMAILAAMFFPGLFACGIVGILETKLFGLIFGVIALWSLLKALIKYLTTEYALTDRRILAKRGWIARSSTEIPLNKIASINVHQSFWGRILGYGSIITVDNGGTYTCIYLVPFPISFRREIQKAIQKIKEKTYNVKITKE